MSEFALAWVGPRKTGPDNSNFSVDYAPPIPKDEPDGSTSTDKGRPRGRHPECSGVGVVQGSDRIALDPLD